MKKLEKITKKTLLSLPERKWCEIKKYNRILIVPTRKKHESGYMIIAIVGANFNGSDLMYEIAAYCDDICWDTSATGNLDVRMDCLYPSGVIQAWSNDYSFEVGCSLSSTTVRYIINPKRH